VAERLIDAVAALDYPADRLEIQVLDDSLDETREIVARAVARHAARGIDIRRLWRSERAGFKAGALAAGLASAKGEFIALFDADFVPLPGFLREVLLAFTHSVIGMVQARWGHLNRRRSFLTRAQATMLDSHFLLEHASRMGHGLFFNFNGTAGVWRRQCIEDAGGWSHETLTEDLDLSYRAQLSGWRFAFAPGLVAPAELPSDMEALKSQQRRWAKGSIQTARKLLPAVLRSDLPRKVKLEAALHLTGNVAYPLLLALSVLLLPVLLGPSHTPLWAQWSLQALVVALGVLPVCLFLAVGSRLAGRGWSAAARDVAAALVVGAGLSLNNSRAVLEGASASVGDWQRTPKTGETEERAVRRRYPSAPSLAGWIELALALYFLGVAILAFRHGLYRAAPFPLLLLFGFGYVGATSLYASFVSRNLRSARGPSTARDE